MLLKNNSLLVPKNQYLVIIFSVFFLLLPLIYNNEVIETASLPRHILITGIACILLLIIAIQFFSTKAIQFEISKIHAALFAFYSWALLSMIWSVDIKNTITELTQLTVYFIIAFFASQLHGKNQIKQIMSAIYIGASIAAIIGILQAFNFNPLELKSTTPLASTFNNKNHAAAFFDLVIPLALISMLTEKSYRKYIASITYTLAVTFILLSKTKGSILGYFIFTLFFIFILYKNKSIQIELFKKKNILQYLLLSFIVPISIYTLTTLTFINSNTPPKWNTDLTKSSTSVRLSLYKNAYALLEDNFLTGVGYGGFRHGFSSHVSNPNIVKSLTVDQSVAQLHNDPYQIFLELGLIGGNLIILFFGFIIFKTSYLLSTVDIKNKGSPSYLLFACYLALISSISHSFVDFPLRLPSSATLFWFITGLTILLLKETTIELTKNIVNERKKRKIGIVLIMFCIALAIHSIDLYQRFFSASKLQYDATLLMIKNKNNCPNAKIKIDQALNLFFESHSIRHRYSQIYSYCDLSSEIKLAAMNRVLNYDSTHLRARHTRGRLNLEKKEYKQARIDFEYLIRTLPHRPSAYLGLGDIETLTKNYKNARSYYEKVKQLEPNNQKANFMLNQFNEKGI